MLCPGPCRSGPQMIGMFLLAEQVAGILQMDEVLQLERHVMHF